MLPGENVEKADEHKEDSCGPALNIFVFSEGTKDKGEERNGTAEWERSILACFKVEIQKLGRE